MADKWRPERVQPGNPHELTRKQHYHSAACIQRFADGRGKVGVRMKDGIYKEVSPKEWVFAAHRAWSQQLESGLFNQVESRFQAEADSIIETGSITDVEALYNYLSVWQIRSEMAADPPTDVKLNLKYSSKPHTKDEEECMESRGVFYMRGDTMPGRLGSWIPTMQKYDRSRAELRSLPCWIVLRSRERRFISADAPGGSPFIVLSPTVAVLGAPRPMSVTEEHVAELNEQSRATCFRCTFGLPGDV